MNTYKPGASQDGIEGPQNMKDKAQPEMINGGKVAVGVRKSRDPRGTGKRATGDIGCVNKE
jgi:hypothetical protein